MPRKHQLAAILFTDMVGYSALMEKDEQAAMSLVEANRRLQQTTIDQYGGQWHKEMGDGTLISFSNAADAVRCALDIQRHMQQQTNFQLRIGIHLDEVIFDQNDVFGNGVNIAARLEQLADPGGIYISEAVFRAVQDQEQIQAAFLGKRRLKNVGQTVGVYALQEEGLPQPRPRNELEDPPQLRRRLRRRGWLVTGLALLLIAAGYGLLNSYFTSPPADQSIAVLPFRNLSNDPEQAYFTDGMVEMVRNHLSRVEALKVTSMTSVLRYRDSDKTPADIGRELGVRYLLEGSVFREGDQVRVMVQLIEAADDQPLWSETYDRKFSEILGVQNELARHIVAALRVQLTPEVAAQFQEVATQHPKAYDLYLQGMDHLLQYTREDNEQAINLFHQALQLDPDYHAPKAGLASAYVGAFSRYGHPASLVDSAVRLSEEAIRRQPNLPDGYFALALAYSKKGRPDLALEYNLKTVERDPNHDGAIGNIGINYYNRGQLDEALRWYRKGLQLHPDSYVVRSNIGSAVGYLGRFRQAEYWFQQAIDLDPGINQAYIGQSHFYLAAGDTVKALRLARELHSRLKEFPELAENIGEIYRMCGRTAEAKAVFQEQLSHIPDLAADWYSISPIGYAYCLLQEGKRGQAEQLLHTALQARLAQAETGSQDKWLYGDIATIYVILGRAEEGCHWLQRAVEVGWRDIYYTLHDPYFANIIRQPCFRELTAAVSADLEKMAANVSHLMDTP